MPTWYTKQHNECERMRLLLECTAQVYRCLANSAAVLSRARLNTLVLHDYLSHSCCRPVFSKSALMLHSCPHYQLTLREASQMRSQAVMNSGSPPCSSVTALLARSLKSASSSNLFLEALYIPCVTAASQGLCGKLIMLRSDHSNAMAGDTDSYVMGIWCPNGKLRFVTVYRELQSPHKERTQV